MKLIVTDLDFFVKSMEEIDLKVKVSKRADKNGQKWITLQRGPGLLMNQIAIIPFDYLKK